MRRSPRSKCSAATSACAAGVVTGDELLIEAALERLSNPEYVGPSKDLARAIGSLALLELRSQRRGLLAYFGFDGRDLLCKAREDLRWLVWFTPLDDERDDDLDDLIGFHPPREIEHPTEWQLEEARATFSRSYTLLGRTPPKRENSDWDTVHGEHATRVPELVCGGAPASPQMGEIASAYEHARELLLVEPDRALAPTRHALALLVEVATPSWPATGGPWWFGDATGLVANLGTPRDEVGWASIALADTVADLESDEGAQSFWWSDDYSVGRHAGDHIASTLATVLCHLREAYTYADVLVRLS